MKTAAITVLAILSSLGALGQSPVPAPRLSRVAATGASFLGVMVQEIDSDRAKALKLHEEAGVEITRIEPGSPAEKAGLTAGDAILQYNGQRVEGMEQFSRLVRETPAGREVKLSIVRGGASQTLAVKMGTRPMQMSMLAPVSQISALTSAPGALGDRLEWRMPDMPRSLLSWRNAALGIECESLEGQLAQYFGAKEGVLVRSVSKNSAAEKAGIKAGDAIVRVDDAKVATPADLSSRIRSLHGHQASLVMVRDRKEMTLSVTFDAQDPPGWGQAVPARPMQ